MCTCEYIYIYIYIYTHTHRFIVMWVCVYIRNSNAYIVTYLHYLPTLKVGTVIHTHTMFVRLDRERNRQIERSVIRYNWSVSWVGWISDDPREKISWQESVLRKCFSFDIMVPAQLQQTYWLMNLFDVTVFCCTDSDMQTL